MAMNQNPLMQQHQSFHSQSNAQHATAQSPGQQQPWGGPFPSLHLWPIQDTFQMKMIHLPPGQKVKIGRQTNNKTVPGERNAYFDSKVLSRTHAEIWEQGNKIYIKDVKSSNGTFINGVRLSLEGVESEPFELKSEDMVEFGIDIISEDNRTIIHHKVSAKAYCVFNTDDANLSGRELAHYQNDPRGLRRPASLSQGGGISPHNQMGPPVMSAGGKANGLTFEHVLQKLQNELNKSKETSQELQNLNTAINEVQDTLGGGIPPGQNGSASQYIPAQFRNPSAEAQAALAGPHGPQAAAYIALQTQMSDIQSSLSGHLDRIRELEDQIRRQDALKQEVANVRIQMEESKREMEAILAASQADDDDDARSVATVMPEDDMENRVEEHQDQQGEISSSNGKAAPSPDNADSETKGLSANDEEQADDAPTNAELAAHLQTLTTQMAETLQLSKTLQAQHGEAMTAVKALTERVGDLENGMASHVSAAVVEAEGRWESWRLKFEEAWKKERNSWETERERLRGIVRDWEEASRRAVEEDEDREMNETLSEDDDLSDEEVEEPGQDEVEAGELLAVHNWPHNRSLETGSPPNELTELSPTRAAGKPRRRRPSTRAQLAVRGLRSVSSMAGSATPKAGPGDGAASSGIDPPPRLTGLRRDALNRVKRMSGRDKVSRSASPGAFADKESSESGRESADTLRGEKDKVVSDRKVDNQLNQAQFGSTVPIATVIVVAAVAGLLYYRHKE